MKIESGVKQESNQPWSECHLSGRVSESRINYELSQTLAQRLVQRLSKQPDCDLSALINRDKHYIGYLRVPSFLHRQLNRFGVPHELGELLGIGAVFSLWIKAADDAIDCAKIDGDVLMNSFRQGAPHPALNAAGHQELRALTATLIELTRPRKEQFIRTLEHVHQAANDEAAAKSMSSFIHHRIVLADRLTESMLEALAPALPSIPNDFHAFLLKICRVGNLADSLFDLRKDLKDEIFPFKPNAKDVFLLFKTCMKGLANLVREYPFCIYELRLAGAAWSKYLKEQYAFRQQVCE